MKMRREDVKTEWEKPKESPLSELSTEQVHAILKYRSDLFNDIATHYKNFIDAIYKLPIHVVYRQNSFMNIDQGFHWAEKGINNLWDIPSTPDNVDETKTTAENP